MMKALERQVDGTHYKTEGIEPAEFILSNDLGFAEGNAIKYVARHKEKGGVNDLLKAKHYIDMLLEAEYGCDPDGNYYPIESTLDVVFDKNVSENTCYYGIGTEEDLERIKKESDEMKDKVDNSKRHTWVDTFDDLLMMQLSEMPSVIDLFDAMVVTHDECNEKEQKNEGCSAIWDQKLFGECKKV